MTRVALDAGDRADIADLLVRYASSVVATRWATSRPFPKA